MKESDKLSEHFTFGELTSTSRDSLLKENREEALVFVDSAKALCETLLEPIRKKFGPVVINSGFRGPTLNKAIGGSETSQHMKFEAADFYCSKASLKDVFNWIKDESGLKYGQVILEGRVPGKPTWVHISLGDPWRPKKTSMQALVFNGKKYSAV